MRGEPHGWTHQFGDFRYDARTGEIWKGQDVRRLSPRLATLLQSLIDHPGELVTRETLRGRIWPTDTFVDFEHGLTVAMNRLRRELGESPEHPALIETIPRRGYRWLAVVEKSDSREALVADVDPTAGPAPTGRGLGSTAYAVLIVLVVVSTALGWHRWESGLALDEKAGTARLEEPFSGVFAAGLPDARRAAYDAYVKARVLPSSSSPAYWRTKVQHLRLAIIRNPRLAAAHAELGSAYAKAAFYGFAPAREALRDARSEALEALWLDERLADAHLALGDVQLAEWDWAGAISSYERALSLDPDSEPALESLARLLTYAGRFDRAIALERQLLERDPVSPRRKLSLVTTLIHARRFDEAHTALRSVSPQGPAGSRVVVALAIIDAGKGMCVEAVRDADRALAVGAEEDEVSSVATGWVYATCGRRADALQLLQRCELPTRSVAVDPVSLAALYGALGDRQRGLELIARAVAERSPVAIVMDVDMMLDTLRADPRFERLASRVRGNRDSVVPNR